MTTSGHGQCHLDPDARIQESIRQLFRTFRRTGSATSTVKAFREQGLKFPRRIFSGPRKGDVLWTALGHSRVLWVLHHPRYTGAFCFGRSRRRKHPDGRHSFVRLAPQEWIALIRDAHEGYISWEDFEYNVQRLRDNTTVFASDREKGVPREGPALLQGLAICGVCGQRMTIRYHQRGPRRIPDYVCQRDGIQNGEKICQQIHGEGLDKAISTLLIQQVTPLTLEVALAVQAEIETRSEEGDRLRRQEVECARYQTDLARRRFMQVDPDNRLVADSLEAEWNETLRALADAQERYEKQRQADRAGLNDQQRASIMALARDFPRLWNDPRTPDRERKRMVRLLIADVTLLKGLDLRAQVRFNGGATQTLHLPLPLRSWMVTQTPTAVVAEIDRLFDAFTAGEIAAVLNRNGVVSGAGHRFNRPMVTKIRKSYKLKTRIERLRAQGLLTPKQIAKRLDVSYHTVKIWRRAGLLVGHCINDKGQCLFEDPGADAPIKYRHQGKLRGKTAAARSNDTRTRS